jgi:hypothetical protein
MVNSAVISQARTLVRKATEKTAEANDGRRDIKGDFDGTQQWHGHRPPSSPSPGLCGARRIIRYRKFKMLKFSNTLSDVCKTSEVTRNIRFIIIIMWIQQWHGSG